MLIDHLRSIEQELCRVVHRPRTFGGIECIANTDAIDLFYRRIAATAWELAKTHGTRPNQNAIAEVVFGKQKSGPSLSKLLGGETGSSEKCRRFMELLFLGYPSADQKSEVGQIASRILTGFLFRPDGKKRSEYPFASPIRMPTPHAWSENELRLELLWLARQHRLLSAAQRSDSHLTIVSGGRTLPVWEPAPRSRWTTLGSALKDVLESGVPVRYICPMSADLADEVRRSVTQIKSHLPAGVAGPTIHEIDPADTLATSGKQAWQFLDSLFIYVCFQVRFKDRLDRTLFIVRDAFGEKDERETPLALHGLESEEEQIFEWIDAVVSMPKAAMSSEPTIKENSDTTTNRGKKGKPKGPKNN